MHDLNETPWPFPDNRFDEVYAIHVIEHLDSILRTMEEIHRVSRPHAKVTIITPHHTDASSWRDPTHKWHLNSYSFSYFEPLYHTNFYTRVRFKILRRDVELASVWQLFGLQSLINLDNRFPSLRLTRKFWEHYLCFFVRGKQMTFLLEVIKRDSSRPKTRNSGTGSSIPPSHITAS